MHFGLKWGEDVGGGISSFFLSQSKHQRKRGLTTPRDTALVGWEGGGPWGSPGYLSLLVAGTDFAPQRHAINHHWRENLQPQRWKGGTEEHPFTDTTRKPEFPADCGETEAGGSWLGIRNSLSPNRFLPSYGGWDPSVHQGMRPRRGHNVLVAV